MSLAVKMKRLRMHLAGRHADFGVLVEVRFLSRADLCTKRKPNQHEHTLC